MKNLTTTLWLSALTVGILCLLFLHFNQSQQLAYVDTSKLLNEYNGMKSARATYETKAKAWQANIDTLTQDIQSMLMEHERNLAGMTKKEEQLSEELLRTKQQQLVQYQQAIRQKAQEEDQQMTQSVLNEINNYLSEYGKSHSYSIILATANGNIVYAEDALDITADVLKGLNSQ